MGTVASVLVGLVAALHAYILVLEMFLWQKAPGRGLHGFDPETARLTAPLAANQGLYNGFLAAGLVWGLVALAEGLGVADSAASLTALVVSSAVLETLPV
ncbi:DUF1304 domain-containing protein, partial [Streptomyces collinus]